MNRVRLLMRTPAACFWPTPRTRVAGIGYAAYLVWLAAWEIERLGTTSYLYLFFAAAVLGAWLGARVAIARVWIGAALTPGYRVVVGCSAGGFAALGIGAIVATGWFGGLDAVPLLSFGGMALSVFLVCGAASPVLGFYLLGGACFASLLVPVFGRNAWPTGTSEVAMAWTALATVCSWGLFAALLRRPRPLHGASLSNFAAPRLIAPRHIWQPSAHRVGALAGLLGAGCAHVQRSLGTEWKDAVSMLVIGSMCAHFGSVGASVSFPRGPLPSASWLLVVGANGSRTGVGRRVLSKVVVDSVYAAGVFSGVLFVLGADFHLLEMLLLALAACHLYLAGASGSRWLMSSRYSAAVAAPVVVALSGAAWFFGPWGLPASIAACFVTGVIAIYIGGIGIGRLDLDAAFTGAASQ